MIELAEDRENLSFPAAPWDRNGLLAAANDDGLALLERWALAWHGAPRRDPELARKFLQTAAPPGRLLLSGAGSHSAWLLDILADLPHLEVGGVIDRMASSLPSFSGLPVLTPEAALAAPADYILVGHTTLEEEMVRALTAAGHSPSRILTFNASPAYAALAEERIAALADRAGEAPLDNLVISCSHADIIPDQALARLLGGGRTLNVFIGRDVGAEEGWFFDTIDLMESIAALRLLLARKRPRVIYVRTILYKNFLLALIKRWSPESLVIGEPYDLGILWSDHDLELLFGLDARTIWMQRLGELLAGREMDLMVTKRGGPFWDRITAPWRAPCLMYFPALQEPPPPHAPGALGDIVYAGFFPAAAFLEKFRSGYNFAPLLTEICRAGGLRGALYNGGHVPGAGDRLFAGYMETMRGPLRYHSRLPYAEMLRTLTGFRYGWLCDHRDRYQGDRHVGVCNRWTGYLSAGLPVLIDDGWDFMVDLTRRFGAGLIVSDLTPDAILAQMAAADWPALREGARALARQLERWNEDTLDQLSARLDAPRLPSPQQRRPTRG